MKDPKNIQIIICGKTGDKVLFPSKILGYACALSGKYCTLSPSIEPRIRGGLVFAELIVSDEKIDYPKTTDADILIALSQGPYEIFAQPLRAGAGFAKKMAKKQAAIFYDPAHVKPDKSVAAKHYALPVVGKAAKELKTDKVNDTVLLSCVVRLTRIVSIDALNKALKANLKDELLTLNLKALELGTRLARKVRFP